MIAETTDLPDQFAKIVVTDDQGRYVIPDLPKAKYKVWVRGYGLVDSPKVDAAPGQPLNLHAVAAPNEKAAAEYYPPIYWYSMLKVPAQNEFPAPVQGNGIPTQRTQPHWLNNMKTNGCIACHALGTPGTRTIPKELADFKFARSLGAAHPIRPGHDADGQCRQPARPRPLHLWGDWTDRIAAGELPFDKPPRPQGIERNLVLTMWDWATRRLYARSDLDRPAQSHGQRQRQDLRRAREQHRSFAGARSEDPHGDLGEASGARSEDAETRSDPMAPSAYWGDGADLGRQRTSTTR